MRVHHIHQSVQNLQYNYGYALAGHFGLRQGKYYWLWSLFSQHCETAV